MEVSGARLSVPDGIFAPCELVCEIGARPNPVYVVRSAVGGGKSRLVIAERFPGSGQPGEARSAELLREAQRISTLANPHVARAREVVLRGDDLVVFGDFIDGEKLAALWSPNRLTLEIALRVIVDVLSGLSALHNLCDAKQQPMKLVHGEVSPATIVFGLDGAARLLEAVARRVPGARAEAASFGYLAPETHRGELYDARADVFSAGVLLWEALAGEPLFTETDAGAIVARVRVKPVPVASVPEKVGWARGLADVAARALAASPDDRWPTVTAMAAEIRKL
ncbi:MAG TPA: protein kinase, partial [Polyangiaceae bacterium]|nr:protein kinase [Polyangiaceae bacterium]